MAFLQRAGMPPELREEHTQTTKKLAELSRVQFYTSYETLNLHYEAAQTRHAPRLQGNWFLRTNMPWIGERMRALGGAHVELFRGIENVVGVKLGPKVDPV